MNDVGISSQACFVLGYPGEEDEDRQLTEDMLMELTKNGVDEVAIFVVTPVPGSKIYQEFSGFSEYSQLNFSPTWRTDYKKLNKFRLNLYRKFLLGKLRYHPKKILKQPFLFLARRCRTKMEMVPYRALHTLFLRLGWTGVKAIWKRDPSAEKFKNTYQEKLVSHGIGVSKVNGNFSTTHTFSDQPHGNP